MKRIFLNVSLILAVVLAMFVGFTTRAQAGSGKLNAHLVRAIDMSSQGVSNQISLAVDRDLNTYVVDSTPDNPRVLKYDKQGRFELAWGGKGNGPGQFEFWPPSPDAGPVAGFIAVDSHGFVYVSDSYNYRVQKFDSNGRFLMQFGQAGAEKWQFDGGPGPVYVDKQDHVWVSTFPRVQEFDSHGHFMAAYGSGGSEPGQFMGAGLGAIDSHGNMYIVDLFNARVQKLDSHGHFVKAWGTPGTDDGQFFMPVAIVLDNQGRLFVADNTNRVQVFTTDGQFLGKWTQPGKGYPPFGESISGVAIDRKGDIYVEDWPNPVVYVLRVNP